MKPILLSILGLLFSQCLSVAEPKEADNGRIANGKRYELRIKKVPVDDMKLWNRQYEVDRNGCVNLPLVGKIEVSGLSLDEAVAKIRDTLRNRKIFPLAEVELLQPKKEEKRDPAEPKKAEPAHGKPPEEPQLSADESKEFSPATQEVLDLLAKDETSPVLRKFVEKYSMKRSLEKGDVDYNSPEAGVNVMFSDKTVWRVVLDPQVYKHELPLGVARDLPPRDFFKTYQSLFAMGYPKGPEDLWFVAKKNGFDFCFVYDKMGKFFMICIDKDEAPTKR